MPDVFSRQQVGFKNQHLYVLFGIRSRFNVIHKNEHSFSYSCKKISGFQGLDHQLKGLVNNVVADAKRVIGRTATLCMEFYQLIQRSKRNGPIYLKRKRLQLTPVDGIMNEFAQHIAKILPDRILYGIINRRIPDLFYEFYVQGMIQIEFHPVLPL